MNTYRHTQVGWAVIFPVLGIVMAVSGMAAFSTETRSVLPMVAAFVVVVLSLFATLTVAVADGCMRCHFGVGLIWRRIPLRDVQRAEVVRNRWYFGWGIRLTPHGWLWNVSGLDAVELTFATGRKFRIGTDEPEKLLAAVRTSMGRGERAA